MAWVLTTPSRQWRIEGGGIVPGTPANTNSYRSEAAGLYGLILVLTATAEHVQTGSVHIYCDGKALS